MNSGIRTQQAKLVVGQRCKGHWEAATVVLLPVEWPWPMLLDVSRGCNM